MDRAARLQANQGEAEGPVSAEAPPRQGVLVFADAYRGDGEYLRNFEWTERIYESLWTKIKKLFGK